MNLEAIQWLFSSYQVGRSRQTDDLYLSPD